MSDIAGVFDVNHFPVYNKEASSYIYAARSNEMTVKYIEDNWDVSNMENILY